MNALMIIYKVYEGGPGDCPLLPFFAATSYIVGLQRASSALDFFF